MWEKIAQEIRLSTEKMSLAQLTGRAVSDRYVREDTKKDTRVPFFVSLNCIFTSCAMTYVCLYG